jgi:NADPH2 dehydrogenase
VTELRDRHPDLAFIHVVEPRVDGFTEKTPGEFESNEFIRKIWGTRPFISAGGHTRESGMEYADKYGDLIAYGRKFIGNVSGCLDSPDLPENLTGMTVAARSSSSPQGEHPTCKK